VSQQVGESRSQKRLVHLPNQASRSSEVAFVIVESLVMPPGADLQLSYLDISSCNADCLLLVLLRHGCIWSFGLS
jgi:hypothetical protein